MGHQDETVGSRDRCNHQVIGADHEPGTLEVDPNPAIVVCALIIERNALEGREEALKEEQIGLFLRVSLSSVIQLRLHDRAELDLRGIVSLESIEKRPRGVPEDTDAGVRI